VPSVAAIIFPFRRLAIWLSVLVLAVATLAVAITSLLVVPSLQGNLVNARVAEIDRSAKANIGLFTGGQISLEDAVNVYEQLTGNRAAVLQTLNNRGDFLQIAGNVQGATSDPLAREARTKGLLSRAVRSGKRYAAETAIPVAPTSESGGQLVLLFMSPLNDVDRTVSTVRRDVLIAVAVALPVTWMVGLLAAYALAARIRRLERATRRIAEGNLATPVVDDGRDEIHELARAFDDMRRRLERTDRARREFIANASHELRTPLFALGGFLELLEDEEDPDARREFVATMHGQVSRLTRLATDLLDLSRLDAGGVAVAHDDVDLMGVAALAAADFAAAAEQRGASVTVHPGDGAIAIADEARVAQVARALVDNALRHNPEGVEVTLSVESSGGTATLVVADDGPAIDSAATTRLFDRFYRGPGGGEGSGLGLAIAHELAARMGGSLTLVQQEGVAGKAFRLALPGALQPAPTILSA